MKTFLEDLKKIEKKLKNKENFSFLRYSDGERFIMEGKSLIIESNGCFVDDFHYPNQFQQEDFKYVDNVKHSHIKDLLIETFKYEEENYFKGINCPCCNGVEAVNFFRNMVSNQETLTWANLLVNSNYPYYLKNIVPLFNNKEIILIANEKSKFENLPFKVKKFFKVGNNCIINDHHLIEEIKQYTKENNLKNNIFLFSASSLTQILIYNLWKSNKDNTYMNIGTTLNHMLGLSCQRGYLSYNFNGHHPDVERTCTW